MTREEAIFKFWSELSPSVERETPSNFPKGWRLTSLQEVVRFGDAPVVEEAKAEIASRPAGLYDELVSAGCKLDSHESDLYVEATPTAEMIITRRKLAGETLTVSHFTSNIDRKTWIEVAFAYTPFWHNRGCSA